MSSYLVGLAHSWLMFVLDGSWRDPTSFLTLTCFQGLGRGAGCPPTPLSDPKCILCLGSVGGEVMVKDHASCLQSLSLFSWSLLLPPFCPLFMFFLGGSLEEAAEEEGKEFRTYKLMDPLESGPAWSYKDPRQTWGWRWGRGGQDLWT